jgi:hypothetical protein
MSASDECGEIKSDIQVLRFQLADNGELLFSSVIVRNAPRTPPTLQLTPRYRLPAPPTSHSVLLVSHVRLLGSSRRRKIVAEHSPIVRSRFAHLLTSWRDRRGLPTM